MRFYIPILALLTLVGCHEAIADKPVYVPPDPAASMGTLDPFVPATDCDNPDCVCDNCDCDPCQCGADTPDPVPQSTHPSSPSRDAVTDIKGGFTLSLLTAEWCPTCPAAKTSAYNASTPVELVDIDQHRERAEKLYSALRQERTVPMWVACVDGHPVKYWRGASNAAGVEIMAAWRPEVTENFTRNDQSTSGTTYRLKRGDGSPVEDNGLVLPDGRVILPDAPGYPEDYAPPYNDPVSVQSASACVGGQCSVPEGYYYQQPAYYRGGCAGGYCSGGGCR